MAIRCPIQSIEYFNHDTRKVILAIPRDAPVHYRAGQYLEVLLPEKKCPFSIAAAPSSAQTIELHVRPTPDSEDSVMIESLLDTADFLDIEVPKGDCFIEAVPDGPLLLLAASTGITQMKSMIEFILPHGVHHPTYLYWGVVSELDLYLQDICESWDRDNSNFHYVPVVSEPETSPGWSGRTGLVGGVALADLDDVSEFTVYVGGSPGMVYATLDMFVERGLPEKNMFSDVFSYAPRANKV